MAVHFAWMTELGDGCRHRADTAMSGHAVLHVGPPRPHLHLRLHGLRRLRDRRPPGGMFYEAWLLPPDGRLDRAISLGLFNASTDGEAVVDFVWPMGVADEQTQSLPGHLLLVTAQRNDGVLRPSADSVLLGVIGPPAALPAVVALRPTTPAPTPPAERVAPAAEPAEPASAPTVASPPPPAPAPDPAPPQASAPPQAQAPTEAPAPATATVAPPPTAEPVRAAPVAEAVPPHTVAARPSPLALEPAQAGVQRATGWTFPVALADVPRTCPAGHRLLTETTGALIPLLPDLRGTTGNMSIHFERGQCLVTVRGVPAPATWGDDPLMRRPYNVYQAWLRRGRGDEAVSLGFFRRIHHDTYRLQYRGHIPFHAFDTLTVAAADRANATFGSGPALYVATYRHTEPVTVGS